MNERDRRDQQREEFGLETPEPYRHPEHRRPLTRREFLGQGFIAGAAMVMAPSLLGFFGKSGDARAQAIQCGVGAGGGRIPFLCFDLGGGANTAGSNVLVGGPLGQLDPLSSEAYIKFGLPPGLFPTDPAQVDTRLGLAFHQDSAFLRGIIDKTDPTTLLNVNGTVFCARSANDTANNPHNPMFGINKAGADGDLVTLIGTSNSDSGGRSMSPMFMYDPSVRPTKVDRPQDATGLVDTGKLIALLDQDDAAAVMRASEQISAARLNLVSEQQVVKNLIQCAYQDTTDLVSRFGDPNALDPLLDLAITGDATSIFSAAEVGMSEFRKTASVMKLVVNGFAGAGTIEFGGYDYHNSTRATGERKDFVAGQAMGAALEYAARVGSPLVIYVLSDGSVASDGQIDNSQDGRGKGIWRNDNSGTAATFMLVYDPDGMPTLSRPDGQIGWFRDSGSVETSATRIADDVDLLAQAVVLNYMALHNEPLAAIDGVLPGHGLGTGTELDALNAFAALPRFVP